MRNIRFATIVLAAFALVALAGTLPAAAAAPGNTFPGGSTPVDNQPHSIAPNSFLWYNFVYAGDRSLITLKLVNGNNDSGVGFNVFTPGQIGSWWDTPPIGRGTPLQLNCSTGEPAPYGVCQSDDLIWNGQFNAPGTYYVEVVNNSNNQWTFQLTIEGSGVTGVPPVATQVTAPSQPTTAGTTTTTTQPVITTPTGSNIDPGHAAVMDNNSHTFPADTSLWYRFDYAGDKSEITVTLVNAANSGLEFSVFTPGQVGDWWDEQPIGRGTAQQLSCNTGLPAPYGACQSNDLSWVGKFNAPGTYYVQVFNSNDNPMTGQLTIQGDGVSLRQ